MPTTANKLELGLAACQSPKLVGSCLTMLTVHKRQFGHTAVRFEPHLACRKELFIATSNCWFFGNANCNAKIANDRYEVYVVQ